VDIFQIPVRVYYEDTDAGGVVYHTGYLRFMERARTEWLRAGGFEQDQLRDEQGVLFVVRRAEVDFIKPARFNERLGVTARVAEIKRASFSCEQEIRREPDGEILCRGLVKVVCVDAERFLPAAFPEAIKELLTHAG